MYIYIYILGNDGIKWTGKVLVVVMYVYIYVGNGLVRSPPACEEYAMLLVVPPACEVLRRGAAQCTNVH